LISFVRCLAILPREAEDLMACRSPNPSASYRSISGLSQSPFASKRAGTWHGNHLGADVLISAASQIVEARDAALETSR
jgi:plasmid replication initiation protein